MATTPLERMRRFRPPGKPKSKKTKPRSSALALAKSKPKPLAPREDDHEDQAKRLRQALYLFFNDEKGEATRVTYKRRLAVFAKWLDPAQWEDCREMACLERAAEYAARRFLVFSSVDAHGEVLRWKKAMSDQGVSSATIGQRLSALRSLAASANASGVIDWELGVKSPKRKAPTRDVHGPKREVVERLLMQCGSGAEGLRNEALVRLLCTAGFRREEVTKLQRKHFDREGKRLWVQGKGGYNEWLDLSQMENCREALEAWIDRVELEPDDFLIHRLGRPSKQLSLSGVNFIVKELADATGVKVWPHAFRHFAATQMARETKNAFVVKKAMRHRSIQTTQGYIDGVDDQAAEAMGELDKQLPRRK